MKKLYLSFLFSLLLGILLSLPLRVFYTNDTHGTYLPRTYTIEGKSVKLGGYTELEYVMNKQRAEVSRSIYLDAGDQQTGSAFASMEKDGAVGGSVIDVFNLLKPDAACLGNHEFDISLANTRRLIELAQYPFVTTNIENKADNSNFNLPYTIIKTDSLTIGVMGLTLTELPIKVKAENVSEINILPYKKAIDKYIDELAAKTDLIFLLTHNGFEADSLLATKLDRRISMIIGGHSHTTLHKAKKVNGILIVQTGAYLAYLGQIDLEIKNKRIVSHKNTLIPVQSRMKPQSTNLSRYVDMKTAEIEHKLNKVIGNIPEDWIPQKFAETEVSRWMASALLAEYQEQYQADIAVINNGGIRKSVAKGPITLKDMLEMLPFGNTVTVFTCSAQDLINMVEFNSQIDSSSPRDIIQTTPLGWIEISGSDSEGRETLTSYFTVNGETIDPERSYRVITHDYLVGQWDKYLGFRPSELYDTGDLLLDAMVRQVILQYGK
jgi:2',3'-cyclic-nucleotide 2'-phosphodiesterase (5'-nucleotidase family)